MSLRTISACLLLATISAPGLSAQVNQESPSYILPSGKQSVQVPFELLGNAIFVSASMNGKGPFLFALDTGSCCSVFASELTDELGLNPEGEMKGMGAGSASNKMSLVKGKIEFEFPQGLSLTTEDANTLSFQGLWPLIGRKIYGNIGYDVLKDLVAQLDYDKKIVTFSAASAFKYSGSGQTFNTTLMMNYDPQLSGALSVPGLAPIATKFTIDTGAGGTIVSTPLVKANRLIEAVKQKLPMPSHGVGEGQSEDIVGRLGSIRLGQYELQQPLVALSQDTQGSLTMPEIGVNLGGNILRRFTVILNYPGKALILEPNSHFADRFRADASGLILKASGDDFRIFTVDGIVLNSPAAKAGLQHGDIVRTMDGKPASQFALWELQDQLKNSGHILKLTIGRGAQSIKCELHLQSLV